MAQVAANGMTLEVEQHGTPSGDAIVLIRGLGSQLIHWPDALITALTTAGLHVITFDNRDAGLSRKCDGADAYTLCDMADDTIGLMSALGIEKAHVLGVSMGGMIAQLAALRHPARIRSAYIVMSSSMAPHLPPSDPDVQNMLKAQAAGPRRQDVIAHELRTGRAWGSPGWPFDDKDRAALIGRAYDRSYCPEGTARQYAAMMAARHDLAHIEAIDLPVLVVHGSHDRIFPLAHGQDIARRIPGARLVTIDGMGHDLEGALPVIVAKHVLRCIETV